MKFEADSGTQTEAGAEELGEEFSLQEIFERHRDVLETLSRSASPRPPSSASTRSNESVQACLQALNELSDTEDDLMIGNENNSHLQNLILNALQNAHALLTQIEAEQSLLQDGLKIAQAALRLLSHPNLEQVSPFCFLSSRHSTVLSFLLWRLLFYTS